MLTATSFLASTNLELRFSSGSFGPQARTVRVTPLLLPVIRDDAGFEQPTLRAGGDG